MVNIQKIYTNKIIDKEQCPECLDSTQDAVAVYEDGHKYCHKAKHFIKSNETKRVLNEGENLPYQEAALKLLKGQHIALKKRRISLETCKIWDIQIGKYTGKFGKGAKERYATNEPVAIYNYYKNNNKVMQKIKSSQKEMLCLGQTREPVLYGMWRYAPNPDLFITITEGEEDAVTLSQVLGYQYPIVSVPTGAGGAKQALEKHLKYLQGFKYVILGFDMDEDGQAAVEECLPIFEPGRVKVAKWAAKDANDLLKEGKEDLIKQAIWLAQDIRPKSLVTVSDIIDKVLEQPKFGLDWPWETMTKITYGLRWNEILCIVGPSGVGKTTIITKIISHFLKHTGVGVFSFEQNPEDTVRRYVGSQIGLKLEKPGEEWNAQEIRKLAMDLDNKLYLYRYDGKVDVKDIFYNIRYLNKAKGFKLFVIDNLKSLRVVFKKEECAEFATSLKSLVKELDIHVILVSHVNKNTIRQSTHVGFSSKIENPHGNLTEEQIKNTMNKFKVDWENGRMPHTSDIEGGNDIEAVCDYIFGLGRNKVSENEFERRVICVKPLKCGRIDSEFSHLEFRLYWEKDGNMKELPKEEF